MVACEPICKRSIKVSRRNQSIEVRVLAIPPIKIKISMACSSVARAGPATSLLAHSMAAPMGYDVNGERARLLSGASGFESWYPSQAVIKKGQ